MLCTDVALVIVSAVHFCNIITVSGLLLLSFDCYVVCVWVCAHVFFFLLPNTCIINLHDVHNLIKYYNLNSKYCIQETWAV